MEAIITISEALIFIGLVWGYYKLNHDRHSNTFGKVIEIIALYSVSIWAVLGNLKFIVWVSLVAAIGVIKFSTTPKKQKIERGNKGLVN